MAQSTLTVNLKIDVSPEGVSLTFEGLDKDLSDLINAGKDYEVVTNEYRTFDTNDVVIRTVKKISFVDREPELPPVTPTPDPTPDPDGTETPTGG
jgi:hypothetical protein